MLLSVASHRAFQTDLAGDTAVVAVHFNPAGYEKPVENLFRFLDSAADQNLPLFFAEAYFKPVPGPWEPTIFRAPYPQEWGSNCARRCSFHFSADVMWFKEALFNAAEKFVPARFTKIVFVDADIHFHDPYWLQATSAALDSFPIVQPFSRCAWLNREGTAPLFTKNSVAYGIETRDTRRAIWRVFHPGFAWGMRRDFFSAEDGPGGFYNMITGSGDSLLAYGLLGMFERNSYLLDQYNEKVFQHAREWARKVRDWSGGKVGCVHGDVSHFWHGEGKSRDYRGRIAIIQDLDPAKDLAISEANLPKWTPRASIHKSQMIEALQNYFLTRNEDGLDLPDPEPQLMAA